MKVSKLLAVLIRNFEVTTIWHLFYQSEHNALVSVNEMIVTMLIIF